MTVLDYKKLLPVKLNVTADIKKDLSTVLIHMEVNFVSKQQQNFHFLNTTMDFCKLLGGKEMSPPARVLIGSVLGANTFFTGCPITKGYYYIRDYVADVGVMPPMMPKGNVICKIGMTTFVGKSPKRIWGLYVDFEIDPKRNQKGC